MRAAMVRCLTALARWLETTPEPLMVRARSLTALYELDGPDINGGEWRRSQVYGRLQHEFPRVSKRVISRAIEDAL